MKTTKICSNCGKEKVIWKSQGKDKYCQVCWYKIKPPKAVVVKSRPKPVSAKRKIQQKEYSPARVAFLTENEFCKARLPVCTMWATEVHHMKGRIEELYLDTKFWLPVCRSCHDWIENHPNDAHDLGLSLYRLEENESK